MKHLLRSVDGGVLVFISGFCVNLAMLFVFWGDLAGFSVHSVRPVEYGYSIYKKNSIALNYYHMPDMQRSIEQINLRDTPVPPSRQDTIGYGVILGLLWKIFNKPSMFYIQFIQMVVYSLSSVLLWRILLVYLSFITSFVCMIGFFLYTPLVYMNIVPIRDIWAFYGGIVLLYTFVQLLFRDEYGFKKVFIGGAIFAFCQFIRPTIFLQLFTVSIVALLISFLWYPEKKRKLLKMVGVCFLTNGLFFWIPIISFNKYSYNRFFVSVSGHG